MYNPYNYSAQTIDTFEILGGHIVDVYYNRLYEKSKDAQVAGKSPSITEAYKSYCRLYLNNLQNEDLFKQKALDVYEYFKYHSPLPVVGYADWVDKIAKEFTPSDFWPSMSSSRKDYCVGIVLRSLFKDFALFVLSPTSLEMIIDDHNNKDNIPLFQDKCIVMMIELREKLFRKYLDPATGDKKEYKTIADQLKISLQKETKKVTL